jgi:GntR family transcriptional regulator/MocR family aminotransferase
MVGEGLHRGGYPPLQAALAAHFRSARGVVCEPEQVIIASSAKAALALLCRVLTQPGDRCLVEDPGYMVTRRILAACTVLPVPIKVDSDGIGVAPPVPPARLAYLTPTHQMPLGVTLADARAKLLLDWAEREDAFIIEDDYDSEFRYVGQPVVALQHADPNGRVIYIATLSKTMFPGLRVACLIVPVRLVKAAVEAVYLNGHAPNVQVQAALADFIAHGHYAAHIRKARAVYRWRQDLLVAALNHHLEGIVAVPRAAGGMNLVVPLPSDIPAVQVQELAAASALHARAVGFYTESGNAPNALHLGFAAVPERLIEPCVARLAEIVMSIRSGSAVSTRVAAAERGSLRAG